MEENETQERFALPGAKPGRVAAWLAPLPESSDEIYARFPGFRMPKAPAPKPGDEKLPPFSNIVIPPIFVVAKDEAKKMAKGYKDDFVNFVENEFPNLVENIKYKSSHPFESIIDDAINWHLTKNKQ